MPISFFLSFASLQDCDFPEDLKAPETRPEAGIDHVDVMDMLGLKRAKSVDGK